MLTLDHLVKRTAFSRSTVLRRLTQHGYFSSYNHRGKFLIIKEVADFDSRGLWAFKTARFSRHGTLKETALHFILAAQSGMTHEELNELLGVRVHNALLELVEEERVIREKLGPTFVYFSPKRRARRGQVRRRMALLKEQERPQLTSRQVIAALLELVNEPGASRQELVVRCQRSGVSMTRKLMDAIFERYDLDKKRAL